MSSASSVNPLSSFDHFAFSAPLYERFFLLIAGPPKERGCRTTEKPG